MSWTLNKIFLSFLINFHCWCVLAILAAWLAAEYISRCKTIYSAKLLSWRQNDVHFFPRWQCSESKFMGRKINSNTEVPTHWILSLHGSECWWECKRTLKLNSLQQFSDLSHFFVFLVSQTFVRPYCRTTSPPALRIRRCKRDLW